MSSFLLGEQIPKLQVQARRAGIDMRYVVAPTMLTGGTRIEHRADEPIFGASIGKVALAHLVIDELRPADSIVISRRIDGAGRYDKLGAKPHTATVEDLVDDMLRNSGNTAFAMLTDELGGHEPINEFYREMGWEQTRVEDLKGKTLLGPTTPNEALDQMERLISRRSEGGLAVVAVNALRESNVTRHNLRSVIGSYRGLNIINKWGQYDGDEDDPHAFVHDSGVIGTDMERIGYSVMTQSPMRLKGAVASVAVQQFGVELARALGAKESLRRVPRVVGSLRRRV